MSSCNAMRLWPGFQVFTAAGQVRELTVGSFVGKCFSPDDGTICSGPMNRAQTQSCWGTHVDED